MMLSHQADCHRFCSGFTLRPPTVRRLGDSSLNTAPDMLGNPGQPVLKSKILPLKFVKISAFTIYFQFIRVFDGTNDGWTQAEIYVPELHLKAA